MTPLREIAAILGIEVDDEEVEKADKKIEGFLGKLKEAGKIAAEAFAAGEVVEFFKGQVENAAHLQDLAARLGVTAGEINKFGFAAKSAGLDMESAAHALGVLQRTMGQAQKAGSEQAKTFAQLKVPLKDAQGHARPLTEVVGDLADRLQKMPDQSKRAAAAMELFGRAGREFLPVLSQGREKMEELFKESEELGSGLGDDFYESSKEAREEFEGFGYVIASLKERALAAILPYIIDLGRWLKDVAKDVIDFTKRTELLKTVILSLTAVGMIRLAGSLKEIAKLFGFLKPTLGETLVAFGKFIAPLAIMALLYLAFDSLYEMIVGNKSALGDLLDKFGGVGTAAKVVLVMNALLQDTISLFTDIGSVIEDTVLGALETVYDEVKGVVGALSGLAHGDFAGALKSLKEGNADAAKDLDKRGNGILNAGGRIFGGNDTKHLEQLQALLGAGIDPRTLQSGLLGRRTNGAAAATREGIVAQNVNNPLAHGWRVAVPGHKGGGGKGTTVHQVNHNNISVKTASDKPEQVGKAAAGGVEKGIQRGNLNAHKAALVP